MMMMLMVFGVTTDDNTVREGLMSGSFVLQCYSLSKKKPLRKK